MKSALLSAALLSTTVVGAHAASLGLTIDPTVEISEIGVDAENDFFGFNIFGAGFGEGLGYTGPVTELFIDFTDPDILVTHDDGVFITELLGGTLVDTGFVSDDAVNFTDTLELLFDTTSGANAGDFGAQFLVVLTGEFGSDPFGLGFPADLADLTLNPLSALPPIPLPAALPMLAAGLAGLALLRRRG